jgi:hypothetical protein
MPSLSIEFDAEQAIAVLRKYPQRTQRATMRALNRALVTGRAAMASAVAKDMGLKVRDAKDAIKADEATTTKLQVALRASLKRRPLMDFAAKGPLPSMGKGRGVTYRIGQRGRGRIENAFLAVMKSGHRGVFRRVGKGRLPVIELFGPSIGHVFEQHRDEVTQAMVTAFDARLAHELRFAATED